MLASENSAQCELSNYSYTDKRRDSLFVCRSHSADMEKAGVLKSGM